MTHCWKGLIEEVEEKYGFGSAEWAECVVAGGQTCMLENGHVGPHEFMPDSEILVTFVVDDQEPRDNG